MERFRLALCAARSTAGRSFESRTTWIVFLCITLVQRVDWLDVHWDALGGGEGGGEGRRHFVILREPRLRSSAITCRFDLQQLFGELGERGGHAGIVDRVASVRMGERVVF